MALKLWHLTNTSLLSSVRRESPINFEGHFQFLNFWLFVSFASPFSCHLVAFWDAIYLFNLTHTSCSHVGSTGVGKSAIVIQFVQWDFVVDHDPTLENTFSKAPLLDNALVIYEIVDTAGTRRDLTQILVRIR